MMKYAITVIIFLSCLYTKAQENYTDIIRKARKERKKGFKNYKKALEVYDTAITNFPDSISFTDVHWASILAATLEEKDKAFAYITLLTKFEKNEAGYPSWEFIIGEYVDDDYPNLVNDKRWKPLKKKAQETKDNFYKELAKKQIEFYKADTIEFTTEKQGKVIYEAIKNYNPYVKKANRDYVLSFKINDTTKTSFVVHLPSKYNPKKRYPILFFLHGGVRQSTFPVYQIPKFVLKGWNRYYTKYADENEVILVFPRANKQYNWMTPDDGFFMIPKILKELKTSINIHDDKVFISGHSNGATGSFSYAMKEPSEFAGFYGFNTQPNVYTGGTFIQNILNRSFINFSTDQDYYYPPKANDSLTNLMQSIGADYKEFRYNGFPHWFPKFDASEPAYKILFKDLIQRKRNPYPKNITWEFDDNKYGAVDWLSNIKLDTLKKKAPWHKQLNFKIKEWKSYDKNKKLITKPVDIDAFKFPRKSGKIEAIYHDNTFRITTSIITSFTINILPEQVNLQKKIKVYVNNKLLFNKKLNYDKEFMIQNFKNNKDRGRVWVNTIDLALKE